MNLHMSMKKDLAHKLTEVDQMALTTDLWTSSNQTPFMVVSAHYILADWTLQKRLIGFKELPTPHTGLAIGKELLNTIDEWNLVDKIGFITVDNASANDVAVAHVISSLKEQSRRAIEFNGDFFHVRCSAHIINLIVKDGLKHLSAAISKIRESV
jgi:hypothetical protein